MSADNTVLILETPDGYKVAEVQAAENLEGPSSESKREYIEANFGDKPLLYREQDAWTQAGILYKEITFSGRYIEYGIQLVKLDENNEIAAPSWISEEDHESEISIQDGDDY